MAADSLSSAISIDLYIDESYLFAIDDDCQIPISDEKYAESLQLQEVLESALRGARKTLEIGESSSSRALIVAPSVSETGRVEKKAIELESHEFDDGIVVNLCGICMDAKSIDEIFKGVTKNCSDSYCNGCISRYIASKINENIANIKCPNPNCDGSIDPENCVEIVPKEVFERWEAALCESLFLGWEKVYCPHKDCAALLMVDDEGGRAAVGAAECPQCHRMMCATCRVGWHEGVTCEEYGRMGERDREDVMMVKLAKEKQWRRCSNCSFFVEKRDGCNHMTCRCRYEFCYQCGSKWSTVHNCQG